MNPRDCWTPKRPEVTQCASCPFCEGNDKEFGSVVGALQRSAPPEARGMMNLPINKLGLAIVRWRLKDEAKFVGDFICHATAYGPKMEPRDQSEWRQCPGASAAFRAEGERLFGGRS